MNSADNKTEPMLKIEKLNAFYGAVQALKDVDVEIHKGEIITIIGANGAGKSTLLNTICGNPKASSGKIIFEGKEITNQQTHLTICSGIALVPEGRRIFSRLTIEENLELGGFHQDAKSNSSEIERIYTIFPRLKERRNQRAGTLSGGEQQMLAIGRGLMMKPKLLLLDEPSLGLAPLVIRQIFQIIEEIRNNGISVLLVEQNANRALAVADRGYILEIGKIVGSDTGKNLLKSDAVKKAYLGM